MIVGAGNAYVAEAKRQLFGTVAIDLLAGPSEVAVIADDIRGPRARRSRPARSGRARPGLARRARHHVEFLGHAVVAEVSSASSRTCPTNEICGPGMAGSRLGRCRAGPRGRGALMDDLAPEHLEVQTADDDWYHDRLTNYGSLFLGDWSTVAYSDKGMAGTNHVLPTAGGARHSAGLSVGRFLKPLTYQRIDRARRTSSPTPWTPSRPARACPRTGPRRPCDLTAWSGRQLSARSGGPLRGLPQRSTFRCSREFAQKSRLKARIRIPLAGRAWSASVGWESACGWLLVGEELAGLVFVAGGGEGAVGGEEGVHVWVGVVEPPGAHAGAGVLTAGFPGSQRIDECLLCRTMVPWSTRSASGSCGKIRRR